MPDVVSAAKRSEIMSHIHGKNTKPEILVRRRLFAMGYRFRIHRKDLPGCPDIVLPKFKTVVFVHGCFWHGHADCKDFRLPKSNTVFWKKKIHANMGRDEKNISQLKEGGWSIVVIWECALENEKVLSGSMEVLRRFLAKKKRGFIEIRSTPATRAPF